jgi:hypothetical protein
MWRGRTVADTPSPLLWPNYLVRATYGVWVLANVEFVDVTDKVPYSNSLQTTQNLPERHG